MNDNLKISTQQAVTYLMYMGIGLLTTYSGIFLARDRRGWGIFIVLMIFTYIKNKNIPVFILFHIMLLKGLIYNTSTSQFNLFLLDIIKLSSGWVPKSLNNLGQATVLLLIVFIFIRVFIERRELNHFSMILLFLMLSMWIFMISGAIIGLHGKTDTINALFQFSLIFLVIIYTQLEQDKHKILLLFKYLLFSIGVFQILLIVVGWFPAFLYSRSLLSGDWFVGSTATNIYFVSIIGIALIHYLISYDNNYKIVFSLLLLVFLSQSGTQTVLLLSSIIIGLLYMMKSRRFSLPFKSTMMILAFSVFIFFVSAAIFPFILRHVNYGMSALFTLFSTNPLDHPKALGIIKIIDDFSKQGFVASMFGLGSGSFFDIQDSFYFLRIGSPMSSVMTAVYTPLNIVFYDFGVLTGLFFIFGHFAIYRELKRNYQLNKNQLSLSAIIVWIFLILSHVLIPLTNDMLISLTAALYFSFAISLTRDEQRG